MRTMSPAQLLEQLNARLSASEIRETARIINELPPEAELGAISVALGIIPRGNLAQWRRSSGRVPVMIADALMQGIRGHMAAINRTRGARYAGSKPIRITIVDGAMFGLSFAQRTDGMHIELTMGNHPPPERPGQQGRRSGGLPQTGSAA